MITKKYLWVVALVFLVIGFFVGQYFGVIPVFASDNDHDGLINSVDTDDDNDGILDVDDKYPFDQDNDGVEDDVDADKISDGKIESPENGNEATNKDKVINVEDKNKDSGNDDNDSGLVSSISVSGTGSSVKWSVDGYSKNGFKIVWSKNTKPTYPTRDGDKYIYLSEPSSRSTSLDAFDGSGKYYVRVCEYLGGVCGVYSNEIQVSL